MKKHYTETGLRWVRLERTPGFNEQIFHFFSSKEIPIIDVSVLKGQLTSTAYNEMMSGNVIARC